MKVIKYLESHGFRIVPVYEGVRPTRHLVVNTEGKTVADFKMLHEAEDFIVHNKAPEKGTTVGSAAELKAY